MPKSSYNRRGSSAKGRALFRCSFRVVNMKKETILELVFWSLVGSVVVIESPIAGGGDVDQYLTMAQGGVALDPWNKRPLVPFLASLFGGSALAFHYLNLAAFVIALFLFARTKGQLAAFVFLVSQQHVLTACIGEPLTDAFVLLWISSALFLVNRRRRLPLVPVAVFAALTHPIALLYVGLVVIMGFRLNEALVLLPGLVVQLLLLPETGLVFFPWLNYRDILLSLNLSLLGLGAVRPNREGFLAILAFALGLVLCLFASYTARMLQFAALLLAPGVARLARFSLRQEPTGPPKIRQQRVF